MKRWNAHEVTLRAVLEMLFMYLCPHLVRWQTLNITASLMRGSVWVVNKPVRLRHTLTETGSGETRAVFEMPYYHTTITISAACSLYAWNTQMTYYICQNLLNKTQVYWQQKLCSEWHYYTTHTILQYAVWILWLVHAFSVCMEYPDYLLQNSFPERNALHVTFHFQMCEWTGGGE